MTPLSPSEQLPLREADGPERESKTGYIQRLQIRGSTENTATGSRRDRKRGENRGRECRELKKRLKMRFKKRAKKDLMEKARRSEEKREEAERKNAE